MSASTKTASSKLRHLLLGVVVILLGGAAAATFFLGKETVRTFPRIKPGAYEGQISGISESNEAVTIYAEQLPEQDVLRLVVFEPGWDALLLRFRVMDGVFEDPKTKSPAYHPFSLEKGEQTILLSGFANGKAYAGDVLVDGEPKGEWELNPISRDRIKERFQEVQAEFGLEQWLSLQAYLERLEARSAAVEQAQEEKRVRYLGIKKFVEDEQMLRERAEQRRKLLASDVIEANKKVEKIHMALKTASSQQSLLNRITKRGKTVSLARRVANRENRWYLTHWKTKGDVGGLEEEFADKANIDLRKLNRAVKKGSEIRALQQEIAAEKEKIRLLQTEYQQKIRSRTPGRKAPQQRKRRSFWEKLLG